MTNQQHKEKLQLFHISRYREGEAAIEEFIPRIPENRMDGENDSMPRICVSDSLTGCFTATSNPSYEMYSYTREEYNCPYQHMSYLDILLEKNQSGQMYRVYHFEMDESEVVSPAELHEKGWVPDALETNEHWITANRKPDRISYIFLLSVTPGKGNFNFRFTEMQEELDAFGVMMGLDELYFYTERRNQSLFQVYSKEVALEIKATVKAESEARTEASQTANQTVLWNQEIEVSLEDLPSLSI